MILGPNPPPMNGAMTRTCDSRSPSIAARPLRIGMGACVVSHTVSSSARASHEATMPRFSSAAATPRSYRKRRATTRWAYFFAAA